MIKLPSTFCSFYLFFRLTATSSCFGIPIENNRFSNPIFHQQGLNRKKILNVIEQKLKVFETQILRNRLGIADLVILLEKS